MNPKELRGAFLKLKKDDASQPISISDMTREELEQFIEIEKAWVKYLAKEVRDVTEAVNYLVDRFDIKLEKEE